MIPIKQVLLHLEETVTVQGWVSKVHALKKHCFIHLRDGVAKEDRIQVVSPLLDGLYPESFIEVTGKVSALPKGAFSYQPVELHSTSVKIIGKSSATVTTICPVDAGPELRLDERPLFIRHEQHALIVKMRAELMRALRRTFEDMGCTEILPPFFVSNQCEGGATLFKLKHPSATSDDMDAFLTQSSQFYLEYCVPAVGDCYCIGPSFRAERSHTRRHATEYIHAETEWKGVYTLEQHLDKLRIMMQSILEYFLKYTRAYLEQYDSVASTKLLQRVEMLKEMTKDILVLTHREAIDYCNKHGILKDDKEAFTYHDDIPESSERKMIDKIGKIVFLCKFPLAHKSFYMAADPKEPHLSWGCDVEVPGVGEVVGSGVRVADYEELRLRLKDEGLKESDYKDYLDLRKYGPGQTSGMGLGVDRLLTWLLDQYTIRDVITFPRYPGRVSP